MDEKRKKNSLGKCYTCKYAIYVKGTNEEKDKTLTAFSRGIFCFSGGSD